MDTRGDACRKRFNVKRYHHKHINVPVMKLVRLSKTRIAFCGRWEDGKREGGKGDKKGRRGRTKNGGVREERKRERERGVREEGEE
jgi:hypothetical protein